MQTAGDLIAAAAELAACMKHSQNDRYGRQTLLPVDVHGDTTAVVLYGDDVAGQNFYFNMVAEARKSLVYGVVDNLIDKVVQSPRTRGADIHARALSDGLKALKHLNLTCVVLFGDGSVHTAAVQSVSDTVIFIFLLRLGSSINILLIKLRQFYPILSCSKRFKSVALESCDI